jgi:hypothetical protein
MNSIPAPQLIGKVPTSPREAIKTEKKKAL